MWFLVQLNQSVVLTQIGYGGKKGDDPFDKLFTLATGNVRHNPYFVNLLELIHSHP
jgi:hypothetical protein